MADLTNLTSSFAAAAPRPAQIRRVRQRPLDRIFAHTGFSIDDVVDSPIAKNAVLGYFRLSREIDRVCEVIDLERQWNAL